MDLPDRSQQDDQFPQAAKEWYVDLKGYAESDEIDAEDKKWFNEVFLKEEPKVEKVYKGTEMERQELNDGSRLQQRLDAF